MTKDEIRAQIAGNRPDFQTLEKMSATVIEKFQGLELFQKAKTVGIYMPLPDEVDIRPLFVSAGAQAITPAKTLPDNSKPKGGTNSPSEPKKTFFIPAFDEALGSYRMAKYTPELKKGKFGIPEPAELVFAPKELDLIVVPGIAFDRSGNRIGRGGGFYDRLLPQYRAIRAGVCFDFQWLENIPAETHDCQMDLLVTNTKILKFEMNS